MKAILRNPYVWVTIAALLFAFVSLLIETGGMAVLDAWIIERVRAWETEGLTRLMELWSWLGSTSTVIILVIMSGVLLFFTLKHRAELILLAAAVGGSALVSTWLKKIFRRERPELDRLVEQGGFSYPSGHAIAAVALYGTLAYLLWEHIDSRWGKTVLLTAGLCMTAGIGVSRIYLGVHYPSDIAGGYLVSGFWLALCIRGFHCLRSSKYTGGSDNAAAR